MTLLHKLSFAAILSSGSFAVASSIPKTILPDNVIRCEPNTGCTSQTLYGRNYKVLNTARYTVMVAISREGIYTRADVSVTNKTDAPLSLTPDDFRVEVLTPKPKVLLYIPPASLTLPAAATATPHSLAPPANDATNPSRSFLTAGVGTTSAELAEKTAQQDAAKAATEHPLSASSIPPNEASSGRVYFERDKHAHLVNVVLPIAGQVFEFPYAMKK
jgi:hypothetical protein